MTALTKSELGNAERAASKGSMLVGMGADWGILSAGSDGKVLAADSTQDGGLKWSAADQIGASTGAGAVGGGTITAAEYGNTVIHKTVLTLSGTPITLTDDAGTGQYGGVKLYDFPAGSVHVLGAVIDADITMTEAWWTDTAEGDVGLGSTLVTNGDALGTTEQNVVATTAIAALTAQVGPIDAGSTAAVTLAAAGTTDADLDLNVRIDDSAAHMPDLVTNGTFGSDTGWTKGTGWTITGGKASSDASQTDVSDIYQTPASPALLAGVSYIVIFTTTRSAGTVRAVLGGTLGTARSTANTFTETLIAGSDGKIAFRASEDFVGTVDSATVTPVTGSATVSGTVTVTWAHLGDF
jgi:hypothetical protein